MAQGRLASGRYIISRLRLVDGEKEHKDWTNQLAGATFLSCVMLSEPQSAERHMTQGAHVQSTWEMWPGRAHTRTWQRCIQAINRAVSPGVRQSPAHSHEVEFKHTVTSHQLYFKLEIIDKKGRNLTWKLPDYFLSGFHQFVPSVLPAFLYFQLMKIQQFPSEFVNKHKKKSSSVCKIKDQWASEHHLVPTKIVIFISKIHINKNGKNCRISVTFEKHQKHSALYV